VISELKDLDWGFEFIVRQHQDIPRMVIQTRSITEKSSDLPTPPTSSMEQQFATFTAELSQRLSEQEARNDYKFERLLGEFQSLKKPVTPAPHSPPYRQASPVQSNEQLKQTKEATKRSGQKIFKMKRPSILNLSLLNQIPLELLPCVPPFHHSIAHLNSKEK
jgi:hypothetical protein